jgi:hypothetical protein
MHEFLAGSWCFVVRCSASRRSFRRRSRIFRSTRVLKLSGTQSRPIRSLFCFTMNSLSVRRKFFPVRIAIFCPEAARIYRIYFSIWMSHAASGEPAEKLGLANCVAGVRRAGRALAPEGGVVSLRRIAPPTLSGARISPGHFSIRPDLPCHQLAEHGFRHQPEEPISLVG